MKPATMYPAKYMWVSSKGSWELNSAAHGCTLVTWPPTRSNPVGWFIQALTEITNSEPDRPVITIGMPQRKWLRGESRSQP